uniref:F-box domain-containing protein n=1 Tax=Strongyloides venezuelensis TaxID=75913 RepID=A0A0K0FGD5_STRVS
MDLNNLGMDFSIEEEYFEVKGDIYVLPDDIIVIILSKLSWEEVNIIKLVSRKFYDIVHRNYHRLERKKVDMLTIEYNEMESYPFHIDMVLKIVEFWNLRTIGLHNRKITTFQSGEKLAGFLKMFDMRDLHECNIYVTGNIDIFSILEGIFQKGTKINMLMSPKIKEKDFISFGTFIKKLSSVKCIVIKHICPSLAGAGSVFSLLSSTSFNTIKVLEIHGCDRTKILPTDFFTNLIKINPTLRELGVGSMNIEFLESAFKEFFAMNQPHQMESECGYSKVKFFLFFEGNIKHLHNILRNNVSKLNNVAEVDISSGQDYPHFLGFAKFEAHEDCKNCLNNRHKITKSAYLCDWDGFYRELYH